MNILLINHYAGSPKYGMEYRPYHLAKEWIKEGHEVTVVAASFSHLHRIQPKVSDISIEFIDRIKYIWLKTPHYYGNGIARFINVISFTKRLYSIDEDIIGFAPDIIIASSPHPFIIYPAQHLRKKYNSKLIFEVRDLWPLTLIDLANMNKWHPLVLSMQHAENYAYRKAYRVVSLLPKASEYMLNHGMTPEKFVYIPNGVVANSPQNNLEAVPDEHSLFFNSQKNKFLVGYTGTFTESDTIDTLISASKMLDDKIHFVLVGDGPYKQNIIQKIKAERLQNVTVLPPVSKSLIPAILAHIDIAYIGCRKKNIYRFGISPNKLFDYMMAAKPVIHAVEAGNDLVAESGCGISVPPEDPAAIAKAIIKLMNMSTEEREERGLRGKEYVLAHHDYKVLANKLLGAIN